MRSFIIAGAMFIGLLVPSIAAAAPQGYTLNGFGPDKTTVGQPGCFGQWRAASGQAIKQQTGAYAGLIVNGEAADNLGDVLSERAQGDFQSHPNLMNGTDKSVYCGL